MTSILDGATSRESFAGEWGRTGAKFEKAILADGTRVVIKHIRPTDWLVVASGGVHLFDAWRAGTFDRVPSVVEHTMLSMEPLDDKHIIVMKDVEEHVLAEGRLLTRDENRRVLRALDALHGEFWDEAVSGMSMYDHYALFRPNIAEKLRDVETPIPALMRRGWELFGDVAPADVTELMHGLLEEPMPLVAQMERYPKTFIHGDARLHNMGLPSDRLVLFDWDICGAGLGMIDIAWYLIISATRIDATREQVIDDYREIAGERFDPSAWDLACIGALMWLGWNKAVDIVDNPDEAVRIQERADLDWWIARVREALETWSPV